MKKMMKYSLLLAMGLGLVSCFDQPESSTTSGGGSTTSYGGTTDNGGSTNDNGGSTDTGGTTSGSTTDTTYYPPPHSWNVRYAGKVAWYPRDTAEYQAQNCNNPNCDNTYPYHPFQCISASNCLAANNTLRSRYTPTLEDASIAFSTDSRYKVRITVNPMPVLTGNSQNEDLADRIYCYRRLYPGVQGNAYSSLKFTAVLQKLNCSSNGNCSLGTEIGNTTTTKTVAVGSSTIIDYTYSRPQSSSSYALVIRDVRDQNNNLIREYDCWDIKVEVSTDYTQDF